MENTIGIAISGLNSASLRLYASASNIAHMRTTGSITDPDHPAYEAKTTQSTTTSAGGVYTKIVTREQPTTVMFDPSDYHADEDGFVNSPNVNADEELVLMKIAAQNYKASAEVIRTQGELFDALIDAMDDE